MNDSTRTGKNLGFKTKQMNIELVPSTLSVKKNNVSIIKIHVKKLGYPSYFRGTFFPTEMSFTLFIIVLIVCTFYLLDTKHIFGRLQTVNV